jgi:hypothetical protein
LGNVCLCDNDTASLTNEPYKLRNVILVPVALGYIGELVSLPQNRYQMVDPPNWNDSVASVEAPDTSNMSEVLAYRVNPMVASVPSTSTRHPSSIRVELMTDKEDATHSSPSR